VRELGQVPVADLERTLNMGIGFVAVLPASQADLAITTSGAQGIDAWLLGEVSDLADAPIEDGIEVMRGVKGVDGGSVQVVGTHPR
jgi:phosphoribosylformylglycinamidine cyclo-ligase